MTVHTVVINKVQPDAFGEDGGHFDALATDPKKRAAFVRAAAKATGEAPHLIEAMLDAAEFGQVRRHMNLGYIDELGARIPGVRRVVVPLFKNDVNGLRRLGAFRDELWDEANRLPT